MGATAPSTRRTIEYCKTAEDLGADALLMLPPYYYPLGEDEIYNHYEVVAAQTRLPIVLYNNPTASGIDLVPELVARLAEIDNVLYIKESSRLASRVHDIISLAGDKIDVFNGIDMIYFDALVSGAVGAIAASLDIIPPQMLKIYSLIVEEHNFFEARLIFDRIFPLIKHVETSGKFVPVLKAAMEIIGKPMGPPRYPLLRISGKEREQLETILTAMQL
jgi:4-hydroxy-tetrahydrodipicolinate synthase